MAHARGPAVQGCFNDRLARGLIVQWLSTPSGGDLPHRPDIPFAHPLAPQLHRRPAHFNCPAIATLFWPASAANIIRQRSATCCGVPCEVAHCFSCVCSAASNLIARLVFGTTRIMHAIAHPQSYLRDTTLAILGIRLSRCGGLLDAAQRRLQPRDLALEPGLTARDEDHVKTDQCRKMML